MRPELRSNNDGGPCDCGERVEKAEAEVKRLKDCIETMLKLVIGTEFYDQIPRRITEAGEDNDA